MSREEPFGLERSGLQTIRPQCPICGWTMADSQEEGCIPGDCSYRPQDPAEQRRIRERRDALAVTRAQRGAE